MINNNCDIIPGEAIGCIRLNETEEEMLPKLGERYHKEDRSELSTVYHTAFMKIWVSKSTGRVDQITVTKGFEGKLFGWIGIGSKLRDLRRFGEVYCEDMHMVVYRIRGVDGVCFELEDDHSIDEDEDEEDKQIEWISVFQD